MQTSSLLEGIQILQKHYDSPDGYHSQAEHDIFYMYATDTPLTGEEVKRMVYLGWFQDDVYMGDEEFAAKDYDAEEGWSAFL